MIFAPAGELVPAARRGRARRDRRLRGHPHERHPELSLRLLWGARRALAWRTSRARTGDEFLDARTPSRCTEVTEYPLERANDALEDLRAGRFRGAAVVVPDSPRAGWEHPLIRSPEHANPEPIEADGLIPAGREAVFAFLADLANHWDLADRWVEVVSLTPAHDGGRVIGARPTRAAPNRRHPRRRGRAAGAHRGHGATRPHARRRALGAAARVARHARASRREGARRGPDRPAAPRRRRARLAATALHGHAQPPRAGRRRASGRGRYSSSSRSSRLRTLPVALRGSSSTKATSRGTL